MTPRTLLVSLAATVACGRSAVVAPRIASSQQQPAVSPVGASNPPADHPLPEREYDTVALPDSVPNGRLVDVDDTDDVLVQPFTADAMTDPPSALIVSLDSGAILSLPHAVNAARLLSATEVVGARSLGGPGPVHAFHFATPHSTDLSLSWCGSTYTCSDDGAVGTTPSGSVAGNRATATGTLEAFVTDAGGTARPLLIDGFDDPWIAAMNGKGDLLIQARGAGRIHTLVLQSDGSVRDIGSIAGGNVWGLAINDLGHVTGYAEIPPDGRHHAFVWIGNDPVDLGVLGEWPNGLSESRGTAIADDDTVFGTSTIATSPGYSAFRYREDEQMKDLSQLACPGLECELEGVRRVTARGTLLVTDASGVDRVLRKR